MPRSAQYVMPAAYVIAPGETTNETDPGGGGGGEGGTVGGAGEVVAAPAGAAGVGAAGGGEEWIQSRHSTRWLSSAKPASHTNESSVGCSE